MNSTKPLVLVVEDQALVAIELGQALTGAGFDVLGPVGTVQAAFEALAERMCDLAVLDVNLGHETSERVAVFLRERNVPIIVASGYLRSQRPTVFNDLPNLQKPLRLSEVIAMSRKLVIPR